MDSAMRKKAAIVAVTAAVLVALIGTQAWAEDPKIVNRPLTPQEVEAIYIDVLPEGTRVGSGLFTVGVGAPIYLEVLVDKDSVVEGVTWSLDGAPDGSGAELLASPLSDEVPIWSPGDREVHDVAGGSAMGRRLLVPDVVGQYSVSAVVDTGDGSATAIQIFTAATYVGVGIVGDNEPQFPQCAVCHADMAEAWAGTDHATKLEREINGLGSSHYNGDCVHCHSVGFDESPLAVNGGFDDVATEHGWEFPTDDEGNALLQGGNFDAMPPEVQTLANIQCESCHGPGSEHAGNVTDNRISVSTSAATCGQCHDELPYHFRNQEWAMSGHAVAIRYPTGEGRESCVVCHSGNGFIDRIDNDNDIFLEDYQALVSETRYEAITCQVCHDPHSAENPHQLRKVDEVVLASGEVITQGGTGKLCMQCHKARRGGDEFASTYHRRHDPHHSNQADMLVGTSAAEYEEDIRSSAHIFAVEDACAGCHMQGLAGDDPANHKAGNHTWRMTWDSDTPDSPDDDVDMTGACVNCHGPMDSFDLPRDDFDGDGVVEGVQTEVEGLMHMLAMELPPIGAPEIEVAEDFTAAQLRATFNHNFVEDDGSHGVHNARYATGILRASIKDLTGRDIITAITVEAEAVQPASYELVQNYPNPFNPETQIHYAVASPGAVQIDIYNSLGQKVRHLVDANHSVGQYSVRWDGKDSAGRTVSAGTYIYAMRAGDFLQSRKMVLLP